MSVLHERCVRRPRYAARCWSSASHSCRQATRRAPGTITLITLINQIASRRARGDITKTGPDEADARAPRSIGELRSEPARFSAEGAPLESPRNTVAAAAALLVRSPHPPSRRTRALLVRVAEGWDRRCRWEVP